MFRAKGEIEMNQIKIGKFIAECRKKNNLTQMQRDVTIKVEYFKWESHNRTMEDMSIVI